MPCFALLSFQKKLFYELKWCNKFITEKKSLKDVKRFLDLMFNVFISIVCTWGKIDLVELTFFVEQKPKENSWKRWKRDGCKEVTTCDDIKAHIYSHNSRWPGNETNYSKKRPEKGRIFRISRNFQQFASAQLEVI